VCGDLGCSECLTEHEGALYCPKHYRPIAQRIKEDKRHDTVRRRRPRQRLVVRYADGRCIYGVSYALNPRDPGFHLDLVDATGAPLEKTELIQFQDLKAVFLVKSFDGRFDKKVRYKEWTPEGGEVVVKFRDGEVIRGFLLRRYNPNEPRFHLIPQDPETNNISVLVEVAATEGVYTPEEYEEVLAREREAHKEMSGPATLSQEEGLGDFYFETRNYDAAREQYRLASVKFPQLSRLRKKRLLTEYNVAIQHIKRHEYDKALACMEIIVKSDPHNERVLKKVAQLRHIIKRKEGKTG
jgi:hypothetical protein